VTTNLLSDETAFIQLGDTVERTFYNDKKDGMPSFPSAWNTFPTKERPNTEYKFSSFSVEFNNDRTEISRQTYSFLDWLGDCGGLMGALYSLGGFFVAPYASFTLRAKLMGALLRFKKSDRGTEDSD